MKEKVYVNIKGLQMSTDYTEGYEDSEEEDLIEVINVGSYSVVNGKEYIKYDEIYEGYNEKCTNLIKIAGNTVEITKKGPVTAHLSFIPGEKTMTCYDTPYGNIYLGVFARNVDIERSADCLKIAIEYGLELNYEQVSDCHVDIEITSKGKFSLVS